MEDLTRLISRCVVFSYDPRVESIANNNDTVLTNRISFRGTYKYPSLPLSYSFLLKTNFPLCIIQTNSVSTPKPLTYNKEYNAPWFSNFKVLLRTIYSHIKLNKKLTLATLRITNLVDEFDSWNSLCWFLFANFFFNCCIFSEFKLQIICLIENLFRKC